MLVLKKTKKKTKKHPDFKPAPSPGKTSAWNWQKFRGSRQGKLDTFFLKQKMPILCQGKLNWGMPGNLGEAVHSYVCLSLPLLLLLSFSPSSLLPLSLFLSVVLCLLVFPVRRKEVRLPSSPDHSTRRILLRGSLLFLNRTLLCFLLASPVSLHFAEGGGIPFFSCFESLLQHFPLPVDARLARELGTAIFFPFVGSHKSCTLLLNTHDAFPQRFEPGDWIHSSSGLGWYRTWEMGWYNWHRQGRKLSQG